MNLIEINKISKSYGKVKALDHISLNFEENKIYGLLGRNGAGKSTLLRIISSRIFPDEGQVKINGNLNYQQDSAQRHIYLMSEENYYPDQMKIKEVFKWSEEFYPNFDMAYAKDLAKQFNLDINKKVKGLSTGYNTIDSVLANINYLSNHAILKFLEGYLYITLLYMIYAMIGLSIAVIYFRMSKRVRIITLISGSIFIVGGPILIGLNSHTAIVRGVIKFIIDLSGIIRNSNIYLVYMIILVVLGALSYQLIKKAVVKTS